jgi:hypothetical protein
MTNNVNRWLATCLQNEVEIVQILSSKRRKRVQTFADDFKVFFFFRDNGFNFVPWVILTASPNNPAVCMINKLQNRGQASSWIVATTNDDHIRFEVFTTVTMKNGVF